eukprot:4203171-Alexandrium_andersonii.AAC.1
MSASLVGSEMCIRDRFEQERPGWQSAPGAKKKKKKKKKKTRRTHYRDGPVSYTHLTLPTICSV